ncbi:MAG: DUF1993 domain-containing protein, partial [Burkholderiales bacterium]|nr:DUF1993 domain-containing protein [Burkholderiales bacterium]
MSLSMYQASIPVYVRFLNNLSVLLQKGVAYAEAKKFDPSVLLNSRLAPDMFPLVRQVQIVTDNAKGCAARLAGIDIPSYEDTETTFEQLQARIRKTLDFIQSVSPAQIDGSETRVVTMKIRGNEVTFAGQEFLLTFALPNLFFHTTTAYAILRH